MSEQKCNQRSDDSHNFTINSISAKIYIKDPDVILKPSQIKCLTVFKEFRGKFISTYTFRARGVSHPSGRAQELIELGFKINKHYAPAFDSAGDEHTRVGWYCLAGSD
ncbi:MAG: helix-turn-helix domain-containing protein [Pseudomonadota bacterium]